MSLALEQINIETYPILKWAGGKRQLMAELLKNIPNSYNRYFEPFVGGGALFFKLQPEGAYISDINEELVNLYIVIRKDVWALVEDLKKHEFSKEYFLKIRSLDRERNYDDVSDIQRASRLIYLNRTCFNGLYRVNSKGHFNVPFGDYKKPRIIDEANLLNCSRLLQKTKIENEDFSNILNYVKKNDFVYLDPPYAPLNSTSNFTSYTKDGFDSEMQTKLKEVCDELNLIGVKFLLSNSDTPLVRELYQNYNIKQVSASRAINSNGKGRGKISEVLVKNY